MSRSIARLRDHAFRIMDAAISAVAPGTAVKKNLALKGDTLHVGEYGLDITRFKRVVVVGAGKASAAMARAVEEILGDRIAGGLVVVKYGHSVDLNKVRVKEAGHPVPDKEGLKGAQEVLSILEGCGEEDLVISLISGGGSALIPLPADGLTLEEKQEVSKVLLACGADIHEMNTVRKHLSRTKGGLLAKAAYPATVVNLMLSDVVGDDTDVIASGPFVPDRSTFSDALKVIEKYNIENRIPGNVMEHLGKGFSGDIPETPGADDPVFKRVINLIIGSNITACRAAMGKARDMGYNTIVLSSMLEGNTVDVARIHVAIAKEVIRSSMPVGMPACIISGGETTVVVKGDGLGGRNQEFALYSAGLMSGLEEDIVVLSIGTDGTDGPTDAAGGIVDPFTEARGREKGLDIVHCLEANDSYNYLSATGDLVKTGPTLTNVMDIHLILIGSHLKY